MVIDEFKFLGKSFNDEEFQKRVILLIKKWNGYETLKKFVEYFEDEVQNESTKYFYVGASPTGIAEHTNGE